MVIAACQAYIGNVLEMFGFLRRRKPNSEEFRYSDRDFNALIGAAMGLSLELEPLIFQGRQKAQRPGENGLQQSDVFSLIDRLKEIAGKVLTEVETRSLRPKSRIAAGIKNWVDFKAPADVTVLEIKRFYSAPISLRTGCTPKINQIVQHYPREASA
jgi:hypothetical protein